MITTIPIGSWYWETEAQGAGGDVARRCVRDLLGVWRVVLDGGLAQGDALADVQVRDRAGGAVVFARRNVPVTTRDTVADSELCRVLRFAVESEDVGLVTVDLSVPGVCLRGDRPAPVQKLFLISVDVWASGAGTVALHTFSDVWMTHNLRGRKHPDVQRENAPLLAVALAGITSFLEVGIVPGDATSYGVPSTTGFEDLPDEDPDLLDSWYMFEVPRRAERLEGQLRPDVPRYATDTELPVTFVEIAIDGRTVGYLWAADGDGAAGYEPYTPAGDVSLEVGVSWLERLGEAKARGLAPSQALHVLASEVSEATTSGVIVPCSRGVAASLEDLQELSGCEDRSTSCIQR